MHMQIQNRTAALQAFQQRKSQPQPNEEEAEVATTVEFDDELLGGVSSSSSSSSAGAKKGKKKKKKKKKKKSKDTNGAATTNTNTTTIATPTTTTTTTTTTTIGFPRENSSTNFGPRKQSHLHLRRIHELDQLRAVSRAVQMSCVLSFRTGAISESEEYELGTDELRFQYRFQQFDHFNQASPIHYKELVDQLVTLQRASAINLSEAIKKQFNYAASRTKIILSYCPHANKKWRDTLKALAKVCVLNGLAMSKMLCSVDVSILEELEEELEEKAKHVQEEVVSSGDKGEGGGGDNGGDNGEEEEVEKILMLMGTKEGREESREESRLRLKAFQRSASIKIDMDYKLNKVYATFSARDVEGKEKK